jgi:TetR/AcrR family transcriptional regulator, ethionamide resistance regulator
MAVLGRKPGVRAARRAETTQRILSATTDLLAEGVGFADITVDGIAQKAGISRTAFYDYFSDRRELLMRIVEDAVAPIFRDAEQEAGGPPPGPGVVLGPEAITAQVRATMRFARENKDVFCAIVEASAYDEVLEGFWRGRLLGRFVDNSEESIRRGQAEGVGAPLHPRAAAQAFVLMVVQTVYDHVRRQPDDVSDEDLIEALAAITTRGIYGGTETPT